ncbi:MCP four helix bundle domain-containing protein, partial [Desulfosarcina sp.]|uniref:MCP four helix bundle domain-containing protein n=1 Tax=Desulfosarcina sp. TaxID=2027861 RepID=UPI003970A792
MFKNMKLSAKLIGSFVIVAVITLAVGFAGWRGVNGLSHHIVEIGEVQLPSVHSLMVIEKEAEAIRAAQRTLLNPDLSREHKAQQFENIQTARNHYEAAWKVYAPLPQTQEEAQLWNKFVPAWEAWRHENTEFLKLIQELDKLDLGNPDALNATIEMMRGDHYKLMVDTAELIDNGTAFHGGEDASACRYGQWAATFKTQNPSLNSAIAQNSDPHRRFHQAVADIKAAVDKGNMENARYIARNALQPAMQGVTIGLQAMDTQVENAVTLFDEASQHAMVTAREKETAAIDLLEQIVKINEDAAHVSSEEAAIES